ncbi:related to PHO23-Protein involved in transcriptional regulation of PHO5 [Zygosaccharomyces bailii ISA1307]|nr:related to PHO23-Protein involved in transcriptional regulation of PHO5 [Zygosaccharomyces bailii ISA1307]
MSVPANLYAGLNDIVDVLEEFPVETSRYLTLLHEIDAKCVHSTPQLNKEIDRFVYRSGPGGPQALASINQLFQELMPSLEEKMHVSSIMLESLQHLTSRLELDYEIAIKNQEIPSKLRLGVDNHPAMQLHHQLMHKIDAKSGHAQGAGGSGSNGRSSQALKSETRREAMVANKRPIPTQDSQTLGLGPEDEFEEEQSSKKRVSVGVPPRNGQPDKKRKRRANVSTVAPSAGPAVTSVDGSNSKVNEFGEPLYCYCNQVAYGEMVGCDGANCELEWFHLPCISLDHLPRGKWYCDDCKRKKG